MLYTRISVYQHMQLYVILRVNSSQALVYEWEDDPRIGREATFYRLPQVQDKRSDRFLAGL